WRMAIWGWPSRPTRPIRADQRTPARAPPSAQPCRNIRCARPTRQRPGRTRRKWRPEATRREGRRTGRWIMQLPRRASSLLLALLLTSAATAHAECAWVMWEQWFAPSSPVPLGFARTGTSSEAACRSELRKAIAVVEAIPPNPGEEQHVDGDAVVFVIRE